MNSLNFYNVDAAYVNYLRVAEQSSRGFSHVPFVDYEMNNRKQKFFCGVVVQINDMSYYVPVSSNTAPRDHTYYLYDGPHIISSLRFDFMFPVPSSLITTKVISNEPDVNYQSLLRKELLACRKNESFIREYALRTYIDVLSPTQENEVDTRSYSCNFRILEAACQQYCKEHHLSLEPALAVNVPPDLPSGATLHNICKNAKEAAAQKNAEKKAPSFEAQAQHE